MKKDQYGNAVPNDLVIIPIGDYLTDEDITKIDQATWYECEGIILVSAKEINHLSETDPLDCDIDINVTEIYCIDDCLKRYNAIDGFYHA